MGAPITKGLVIAGTHSGAGKTTLTLGLMAAIRKRGLAVAPFKIGPDFIDPGHHAHMVGRASRNLDGWMLSRAYNQHTFRDHAAGCDVAVVEGVMGLFDGFSGNSEEGSTAQMAKWLDLPVLLVVDAASMARSICWRHPSKPGWMWTACWRGYRRYRRRPVLSRPGGRSIRNRSAWVLPGTRHFASTIRTTSNFLSRPVWSRCLSPR
ncbi:MAG: hypothetical protein P8Z73_01630 [Desulfobacteraceae bacterium]